MDIAASDMAASMVQYILMRTDLLSVLNWTVGAVMAQACHACTVVTHLFHDDPYTQQYLNDLENMTKVVLEVPNEEILKDIAKELKENNIDHKLWIEQPENIPTCIVLKPYPKDEVYKYMKQFKLFKI